MKSLFRKEILQFFGSVTGYVAVIIFLVVNGLFLWVFPGNYNIPESGYATLEPFFQLAPWLYLFLIPAITMRLFADEKRSGTIELLLTRPLRDSAVVGAKYLAALFIVVVTLLPTLVWYYSVYRLAMPAGNVDTGSTWGAFTGLFFLASAYIAIGIFCSVLTDSQIVAFILAVLLSFTFFLGFDMISGSGVPWFLEKSFRNFSINDHYLSLSRGVIDARDLAFFLMLTFFFLLVAMVYLRKGGNYPFQALKKTVLLLAGTFLFLLITDQLRLRIDLTREKKYTLAKVSKQVSKSLKEPVSVELFLDGKLPPGFLKLQQAIGEKVRDIGRYAKVPVRLTLSDPYTAVPARLRQGFFEDLMRKGIKPTELRQTTSQGVTTTLIFPGAIITQGKTMAGINFLKNDPGLSHEINLNRSVESVEYELVSALEKLSIREKPDLVFLQGNGETDPYELYDINTSLSEHFQTRFMTPAGLQEMKKIPAVIVISNPVRAFTEQEKFTIDQSLMKGSRLLWLINPVQVSLDSLSGGYMTLAFPRDLNLNDQLFRYGVRMNSDLVQDVQCAQILVNTSLESELPRFTPQPWYFSPLLTPAGNHPVSRNLNLILSEFVSSIDTVGNPANIRTSVLLSTSRYGRTIRTPAAVTLESINRPPARELFTRPNVTAGVLLEGRFTSVFKNRMLHFPGIPPTGILTESHETKMMVFSSGTLMSNKVRRPAGQQPETLPLGYDRVTRQTFGNREFFLNAVNYLTDESGIMELRNASIPLRLLNKVKLREEGYRWKLFNSAFPPVSILLFGFVMLYIRKRNNLVHNS